MIEIVDNYIKIQLNRHSFPIYIERIYICISGSLLKKVIKVMKLKGGEYEKIIILKGRPSRNYAFFKFLLRINKKW